MAPGMAPTGESPVRTRDRTLAETAKKGSKRVAIRGPTTRPPGARSASARGYLSAPRPIVDGARAYPVAHGRRVDVLLRIALAGAAGLRPLSTLSRRARARHYDERRIKRRVDAGFVGAGAGGGVNAAA